MNTINVHILDKATADQIKTEIEKIGKSEETPKQLTLELNSTTGDLMLGVEIVRKAHELKVELLTRASGKLSAAGTILAAGGKLGRRAAGLETVFVINDSESDKTGRLRKVNNPNLGLIEYVLQRATEKKRMVKQTLSTMNVLTAFDAKGLGIIDELDGYDSMYKEEFEARKNKKSEQIAVEKESEVSA
jgi:ATP-dependent protease ClpP protease subunit